jgi:hypothetical protein
MQVDKYLDRKKSRLSVGTVSFFVVSSAEGPCSSDLLILVGEEVFVVPISAAATLESAEEAIVSCSGAALSVAVDSAGVASTGAGTLALSAG